MERQATLSVPLVIPPGSGMTLEDFLVEYLLARPVSKQYANALKTAVKHYGEFLGRPATIGDLKESLVDRWLLKLASDGYGQWAQRGRRQRIVALWNAAYRVALSRAGSAGVGNECGIDKSQPADLQDAESERRCSMRRTAQATIDRPAASRQMTLLQFLIDLYAPKHALRAGTLYQYRHAIDSLNEWSGETLRLCDLTDELAAAWLAYLLEARIARITVKNRRRHLLTLWIAAFRVGLVDSAPAVASLTPLRPRPPASDGPPEALSPDMLLTDYLHHYARKRDLGQGSRYKYAVMIDSLNRWSGEPLRVSDL
ncbi:MAG TPA: hypothetical protein VHY20_12280, partial [Pirellulales bacterium]|nr:hypothetical protein [Pirellulales bacterium]